ncbi:hypothetical protein [Microbispora sp. NPDC049125]|uniref:hypothetical protein n=1 Tax=Microbispora sp. NPDC049125 TaxID=3154929 RepID=UPI0034659FAB
MFVRDCAALVKLATGGATVPGRSYPGELPLILLPWYCYTADGGHSVVVAVKSLYEPGGDPAAFLTAAPVKAVLRAMNRRECAVEDGYLVCDLYHHPACGVVTAADDDEF